MCRQTQIIKLTVLAFLVIAIFVLPQDVSCQEHKIVNSTLRFGEDDVNNDNSNKETTTYDVIRDNINKENRSKLNSNTILDWSANDTSQQNTSFSSLASSSATLEHEEPTNANANTSTQHSPFSYPHLPRLKRILSVHKEMELYSSAMNALYVEHNLSLFVQRVKHGALLGHGRLQWLLGVLCANGVGISQNNTCALTNFREASQRGIPEAAAALARRLFKPDHFSAFKYQTHNNNFINNNNHDKYINNNINNNNNRSYSNETHRASKETSVEECEASLAYYRMAAEHVTREILPFYTSTLPRLPDKFSHTTTFSASTITYRITHVAQTVYNVILVSYRKVFDYLIWQKLSMLAIPESVRSSNVYKYIQWCLLWCREYCHRVFVTDVDNNDNNDNDNDVDISINPSIDRQRRSNEVNEVEHINRHPFRSMFTDYVKEQRHARLQHQNTGNTYHNNKRNDKLDIEIYKADSGNTRSMINLGYDYLFGRRGLKRDWRESKKFFQRALDKGDKEAWAALGLLYFIGDATTEPPIKQNIFTARFCFMKGAELESGSAINALGYLHETGYLYKNNIVDMEILENLEQLTRERESSVTSESLHNSNNIIGDTNNNDNNNNSNDYMIEDYPFYFHLDNNSNSINREKWYKLLSDNINDWNSFLAPDYTTALKYYVKAFHLTSMETMYHFGEFALYGRHGIEQNIAAAERLFELMIARNSPLGMWGLGQIYEYRQECVNAVRQYNEIIRFAHWYNTYLPSSNLITADWLDYDDDVVLHFFKQVEKETRERESYEREHEHREMSNSVQGTEINNDDTNFTEFIDAKSSSSSNNDSKTFHSDFDNNSNISNEDINKDEEDFSNNDNNNNSYNKKYYESNLTNYSNQELFEQEENHSYIINNSEYYESNILKNNVNYYTLFFHSFKKDEEHRIANQDPNNLYAEIRFQTKSTSPLPQANKLETFTILLNTSTQTQQSNNYSKISNHTTTTTTTNTKNNEYNQLSYYEETNNSKGSKEQEISIDDAVNEDNENAKHNKSEEMYFIPLPRHIHAALQDKIREQHHIRLLHERKVLLEKIYMFATSESSTNDTTTSTAIVSKVLHTYVYVIPSLIEEYLGQPIYKVLQVICHVLLSELDRAFTDLFSLLPESWSWMWQFPSNKNRFHSFHLLNYIDRMLNTYKMEIRESTTTSTTHIKSEQNQHTSIHPFYSSFPPLAVPVIDYAEYDYPLVWFVESLTMAETGLVESSNHVVEILNNLIFVPGETNMLNDEYRIATSLSKNSIDFDHENVKTDKRTLSHQSSVEQVEPRFKFAFAPDVLNEKIKEDEGVLRFVLSPCMDHETIFLHWTTENAMELIHKLHTSNNSSNAHQWEKTITPSRLLSQLEAKVLLMIYHLQSTLRQYNQLYSLIMGDIYFHGTSILLGRNVTQALQMYNVAAKLNEPEALFKIGLIHQLGLHTEWEREPYSQLEHYSALPNTSSSSSTMQRNLPK